MQESGLEQEDMADDHHVRNASREIDHLGAVLCHSQLLTKQTCNISGLGIT